jgi:hypothetical protein
MIGQQLINPTFRSIHSGLLSPPHYVIYRHPALQLFRARRAHSNDLSGRCNLLIQSLFGLLIVTEVDVFEYICTGFIMKYLQLPTWTLRVLIADLNRSFNNSPKRGYNPRRYLQANQDQARRTPKIDLIIRLTD